MVKRSLNNRITNLEVCPSTSLRIKLATKADSSNVDDNKFIPLNE
jgi:hypothetical protein